MIPSRVPSPNLMVRLIRIALAALLVSVVVAPYASAQQELTFPLFERYLDALRVQANIPGMSAAIVQDEHVAWATGLGFADVERLVRARSDTPYHISGLTEALSAALILEQCVETGHLGLDDRIEQRSLTAPDPTITVRDALTHRSSGGGFKYDPNRYAALTGVAEVCIQKDLMPFRQALRKSPARVARCCRASWTWRSTWSWAGRTAGTAAATSRTTRPSAPCGPP